MSGLSERDVERLAEALHDALPIYKTECLAVAQGALAPVVAAIRDEAKAEAWDEGEQAGRDNADDGYPDPMVENPYRALLDGGDQS